MKTILFLGFIILSYNTYADNFSPSPLCYNPSKPLMYSPSHYIKRYNKEITEYQKCINDFIAEQEKEINTHTKSILLARELLKKQK